MPAAPESPAPPSDIDGDLPPVPDARRSEDGGMALVKAAVESANDAILITEARLDLPGPRIEYVNAAFTRMTGYGVEEIVGQTPRILQGPRTDRGLIARLRNDLAASESFHGETVNYRKDGQEYIVEWRITPLHDAQGNLSKWVAIQRDVTDRVRAQQERERVFASERAARQEQERTSRMKDEFLATLSHELRTPLNAILGWTSILRAQEQDGRLDPDDVEQAIDVIERNARSQVQLVEDLLDMNRIVSGKLRLEIEPLSLAEVLADAAGSVRHAADAKGITLVEATDPAAPCVPGDRSRLRQVFWNLLSNAIKFTPRGGRIEIRQRQTGEETEEILVRDNGQGIEPDFVAHVFDRFRQADGSAARRYGGLGLGLSIVKQLVELHGGTVDAESAGPGQGATFRVLLPIAGTARGLRPAGFLPPAALQGTKTVEDAADTTGGPAPGWEAKGSLRGLRLVLVEDELDQRQLLRRVFVDQGAEVRVAEDAAGGLELVRSVRPQVLVSDLGLPGVDGYEFLRRVRELPPGEGGRVPAVALTAFARTVDRQRALRAGYQAHVAKPAEPAELVAIIANLASVADPR